MSSIETAQPTAQGAGATPGPVLRGVPIAPGLVVGPAHRKSGDLERATSQRVGRGEVADELNRFRAALERSRRQLEELRGHLTGKVSVDDARVLDTHLAYLRDSAFVNDVEKQILEHGLRLEAAVAKVVADYEKLFKLVQSERLRQGAVDLRDVGVRVLRNLEAESTGDVARPAHYVLVARELSIVDMFHLDGAHVAGIVVEEGGLAGHAAVFARSMGIPTLIGVPGLLDAVAEGDALLLDAGEGTLRVRPDPRLLEQYESAVSSAAARDELDALAAVPLDALATAGGAEVRLVAACGSVPEVAQAARTGVAEIGIYRTELLFLADPEVPGVDALRAHYEAVLAQARGARVTFRLLSVDAGAGAPHLVPWREPNPRLGRAGVRLLLAREELLRRQLQALFLALGPRPARVAVPFATEGAELVRVRRIADEERAALVRQGALEPAVRDALELGAILEVPGTLFTLPELATAADFLLVNVDSLAVHLLAADRQVAELEHFHRRLHPAVLGALAHAVREVQSLRAPLSAFGSLLDDAESALLVAGAGLRTFAVAPMALPALARAFAESDLGEARAAVSAQTRGAAAVRRPRAAERRSGGA